MNGARRPVRGCLKGRISAGGAVATLVLDVWRVSTANTNVFFNDVRDDSGIFDLVLKIQDHGTAPHWLNECEKS